MKINSILLLLLLFLVVGSPYVFAQNTGDIGGYVYDARTGDVIPGATVIIENSQIGASTGPDGYFVIKNIPAKTYNFVASFVGYEAQTLYNIPIRSGGNADLVFRISEKIYEFEDIVVTPNPFTKLAETPISIQKLSKTEIESYPGGNNDIAKVVQSLPGVAGSVAGFRNDVIIRGGGPSENVYYLDGVEIPNINHFATQGSAGGPVGLLNVSFFEGVTVTTSAFSAQYDNVLSGVLQFDQRNGNAREHKTNIRVSASEAAITSEGPLGKSENGGSNGSYIASVRRSYLQLLFQAIGLPFLPDYWDFQYRINYKINDKNELLFTGIGSIDDFKVNAPDDFDVEQEAILDQIPVITQRTSSGGLTWRRKLGDKQGITSTIASFSILENDLFRYDNNRDLTGLFFSNMSTDAFYTLRNNTTLFLGDWDVKFGGNMNGIAYSNTTRDINNGFDYSTDVNFLRYGLFSEVSRSFANGRATFSAGIRADGNSFTTDGGNLLSTLSPRTALRYQMDVTGKWFVNAAVGRFYKIPPNTLLGFQDQQGNFVNKDADYIRTDHYTVGIEWLPYDAARISVEGFWKQYSDYPVSQLRSLSLANLGADFDVFGNEPTVSMGKGRSRGLEVLFQQNLSRNFYGILAYTLFWSEFSGLDGEFLASAWDNRQLLTFTGGYKLGRNWEVAVRSRFVQRAPFIPVDVEASLATYPQFQFNYDQIGNANLGSFTATDIRVDKKWNLPNMTINLFLEIQNVLASQLPSPPSYGLNRTETGQIIEPRSIVEITGVDNSSVLPSIGIVLDF